MSDPHVSVVVGVRNAASTLRTSLLSVLQQHRVSFETIVVDDGSTDTTAAELQGLASLYPEMHVIHQDHQGLTRALMHGCAAARGEFIARHDIDDLSLPDRLAKQAERLAADPNLSMVSCAAKAIGPLDEPLYDVQLNEHVPEAGLKRLIRGEGPSHHGSVMFRRSAYEQVGGYRPQFYFAQDWDLWLRLGELGGLGFLKEVLYVFRVGEHTLSTRHRDDQLRFYDLANACVRRAAGESEAALLEQANALRPALRRSDVRGTYFIGRCLLRRGDVRARHYFRRVLAKQPWHLRSWISLLQSSLLCGPSITPIYKDDHHAT